MSTTSTPSVTRPTGPRRTGTRATRETPPPVGFTRTVVVAFRSLVTTRSGFWLVLALAVSTVGVVAARAFLADVSIGTAFGTSGVTLSTLLPAIGAVSMTSTFGSATTASTFLLEPRRVRVVLAQCVPLLALTLASSVLALVAAIGSVHAASAFRGTAEVWSMSSAEFAGSTVITVLLMLAGVALGLLLLNTPLALVILLPSAMFWSTLSVASDTGARLRAWLDLGAAASPLSHLGAAGGGLDSQQLARLGVAVMISIVVPFALGLLRTVCREVK